MELKGTGYPYREGEYVVYRSNGLCCIEGMQAACFDGQTERAYYALHPIDQPNASFFVPADLPDLEQRMRRILTKEQILQIIDTAYTRDIEWIEDTKKRFEAYDAILKTGDRAHILQLMKLLAQRREQLESQRKKLYAGDNRLLANAQRLLTQEFAFVLQIEQDQVIPFILEHTQK